MKNQMGIWLDSEKALLVNITTKGILVEEILSGIETRVRIEGEKKSYSRLGGSLFNPQKKRTKRLNQQLKDYYRKIMKRCTDADEIYILGPSVAPKGLYKLWKQNKGFNGMLYPPETAQKMTQNQLIAKVKRFFGRD